MHKMRPFGELLPHAEALARLLAAVEPVERTEELPLLEARGRVAAVDVSAPFDVPPYARATMDGYAVRAADAAAPGARLRVVGAAHAGSPFTGRAGAGEAVRIATGAPLPDGCDAVARVEDTREERDHVVLSVELAPGRFVDPAGCDLPRGEAVVRKGDRLTPARLGLLASVGLSRVRVTARPRVALHASGDELLRPGEAPAPGRIYDSNSTTLAALFEQAGADVRAGAPLPDSLETQRRALRDAAEQADVVVLTGGASVGERDLAVDALRAEGEVLFHGVRVKPGKPLLAGRIGRALVVGLPGNPTSALTNAALFVLPVLARLSGAPAPPAAGIDASLAETVEGDATRFTFLPVRLVQLGLGDMETGGALVATPTFHGSGRLTSLAESDGWIDVPAGSRLEDGSRVIVHPW